jgi:hypothetical protein
MSSGFIPSGGGIAEGTIRPARFVKVGTDEGALLEADAGEVAIGISFNETRRSTYVDSTAAPGIAANSGEPLSYYAVGARCRLEIAATTTAGALLKSDADGKGTPVTSNNDVYNARALADGSAGELIPVEVVVGYYGA